MEQQFEPVKIVTAESSQKNAADLLIVTSNLEFLCGTTDCQVVDENLRLVERTLRDARYFAELKVAQVLNTNPDSDAQNREHQPE